MSENSPELSLFGADKIALKHELFLRTLLRELTGTLEEVVGVEEASAFISVVSQRMGDHINEQYVNALEVSQLSRSQVAEVLVDLKRRIQGDFYLIEEDEEKIVLGNRACPYAESVVGRPVLCMMTSNIFGGIAAENLGYAKVELAKTIAQGDAECRVVVHLKPTDGTKGKEYYGEISR
jgi:predicted ArsR family transcriptional regulator